MLYNRAYFNENDYQNFIWQKREKILASGHKTKFLNSEHFGDMLIVQEIEKEILYFDGKNYINEQTGEIVGGNDDEGYFKTENSKQFLFKMRNYTLPYMPDLYTEYLPENRVNYLYAVAQLFFEYQLSTEFISIFKQTNDFETFISSLVTIQGKEVKEIETEIGVYYFKGKNEYFMFTAKVDCYKYKQYVENDPFFADCYYLTISKTLYKTELFAFFELMKNANNIFFNL